MTAIISSLTDSFGEVATNAGLVIVAIVAIVVPIVGMVWLTKKAIKWFTGLSGTGS